MAERKFGGREFRVGRVLATRSVHLQTRLLRIIGGGVDRLPTLLRAASRTATPEEKKAAEAAALQALGDICSRANPDEVTSFIKDVVELASVMEPGSRGWQPVDMDGTFSQDMGQLLPVTVWVLKEVLGDFFAAALETGRLASQEEG